MGKSNLKDISRINWTGEIPASLEEISAWALCRIADSLEKMEKPFDQLLKDSAYYKDLAARRALRIEELKRSISSLKGHLTRHKNKKQ